MARTVPEVTVLMTVRNGGPYLREAITSILDQTYRDFRFLILDNASTDDSRETIRSFADPRLDLVALPEDIGQAAALNRGLDMIDSPFIARMDADDVSLPSRLEKQVELLQRHPEVVIVGAACYRISETGADIGQVSLPTSDTGIRWRMLFLSGFAHPSVMLRASALHENGLRYDGGFSPAEDYELWGRLLLYGKSVNIEHPLLKYRIHANQSGRISDSQAANGFRISSANLARLGLDHSLTNDDIRKLRSWYKGFRRPFRKEDMRLCQVLLDILDAFSGQPRIDSHTVGRVRRRLIDRMLAAAFIGSPKGAWSSGLLGRLARHDAISVLTFPLRGVPRVARAAFGLSGRPSPTDY